MKMQKVLSVLLASAMVLSVVACGNTEETKKPTQSSEKEESKVESTDPVESEVEEEKPEWDEITEIVMYRVNESGDYIEWLDPYLSETIGVTVVARPDPDGSIMATMVASGEGADIIRIQGDTEMNMMLEGDFLIDLSQYKDQLPAIFENELYAPALEKQMDTYGAIYSVPIRIGTAESATWTDIRWDLYAELGYPEVKDMDDFAQLLADMVALCPENAEGQKTYAMSLMPAWDGVIPSALSTYFIGRQGKQAVKDIAIVNADLSGEVEYVLADNGTMYNGLKWFYELNQKGLLDPDSITINYDEYGARANAGRYMTCMYQGWFRTLGTLENNVEAGVGHSSFFADCFTESVSKGNYFGHTWSHGICSGTENLEAALRFLNWAYSYEGATVMQSGPEGIGWEIDENGNRVRTEAYMEIVNAGGNPHDLIFGEGKHANQVFGDLCWSLQSATIDPETGFTVDIASQFPAEPVTALEKDVRDFYGGNAGTYGMNLATLAENGFKSVEISPLLASVPAMDEELQAQKNSMNAVLKAYLHQMIFAEDEAEFEDLWKKAQDEAEAGGVYEYYEAVADSIKNLNETMGKYVK